MQGAAEGDVDDLHTPADREQRHARVQGLAGQLQIEAVLFVVDVVDGLVDLGFAVAVRGEVAAARQQQAVEPGEARRHVGGGGVGRVDGGRFAAGPPDGLDQGAGVDLGGVAQCGGGGGEAGGDSDQRARQGCEAVTTGSRWS
jgi:hypothetical protein